MNLEKDTIYNLLSTLEYNVYNRRPQIIAELPTILYTLGSQDNFYNLDKEIAYGDRIFDIDIYATNSVEATEIVEDIEGVLSDAGFLVQFVAEIPEEDEVVHLNLQARYLS